jgi:hypothetical protein
MQFDACIQGQIDHWEMLHAGAEERHNMRGKAGRGIKACMGPAYIILHNSVPQEKLKASALKVNALQGALMCNHSKLSHQHCCLERDGRHLRGQNGKAGQLFHGCDKPAALSAS